jgi:HEAT repeat protein
MTRRRIIVLGFGLVLIAGAVSAAAFDPNARIQGWMNGEPFFQGRSATAWRRELRLPDETAPAAAQSALSSGGGEAVPVCVWLMEHAPEADVRRRAIDAIKGMKTEEVAGAATQLVGALSDSDQYVRGVAIRVVGQHTPDVPGVVGKLIEQFPDREAIRAVAAYRDRGAEAILKLVTLLTHESTDIRRQAARALGKIGVASLVAIPDLIRVMETDKQAGVREQAAEAFGEIGPKAVEAVPHLLKALKDPDKGVRKDAVRSLGQIGPGAKSALEGVKALAKDPEPLVREYATRAARLIDPSGK